MDPISISASCVTLVGAITKTSITVTTFVREVRDARSDLDAISRELSSLQTVLELLAEDTADPSNPLSPALQKQLLGILTNCVAVVADIESSLKRHGDSKLGKAGYWTIGGGKADMQKLRFSLEAHKSALEIALDMVAISLARDLKKDTEGIKEKTAAIKDDTAQILIEIARLQARLPGDQSRHDSSFVLQRYLDDLTSYAESVSEPLPESPTYDSSEPNALLPSRSFPEGDHLLRSTTLPTLQSLTDDDSDLDRSGLPIRRSTPEAATALTQSSNMISYLPVEGSAYHRDITSDPLAPSGPQNNTKASESRKDLRNSNHEENERRWQAAQPEAMENEFYLDAYHDEIETAQNWKRQLQMQFKSLEDENSSDDERWMTPAASTHLQSGGRQTNEYSPTSQHRPVGHNFVRKPNDGQPTRPPPSSIAHPQINNQSANVKFNLEVTRGPAGIGQVIPVECVDEMVEIALPQDVLDAVMRSMPKTRNIEHYLYTRYMRVTSPKDLLRNYRLRPDSPAERQSRTLFIVFNISYRTLEQVSNPLASIMVSLRNCELKCPTGWGFANTVVLLSAQANHEIDDKNRNHLSELAWQLLRNIGLWTVHNTTKDAEIYEYTTHLANNIDDAERRTRKHGMSLTDLPLQMMLCVLGPEFDSWRLRAEIAKIVKAECCIFMGWPGEMELKDIQKIYKKFKAGKIKRRFGDLPAVDYCTSKTEARIFGRIRM